MAQFCFPMLRIEEILNFFHDINVDICDSDFRKPDSFKWRQIYGIILELLTNIPPDQVYQNSQQIILVKSNDVYEYPELHNESLPLMTVTLSLKRVMSTCGIKDFTVQDIIEPTLKRLIKICSATINLYKFRTNRTTIFQQLKEENEKFRDLYDDLRQKINKHKAIRTEEEPAIARLQHEIEVFTTEMASHHKQQSVYQKNIQEIKTDLSGKRASKDKLKVDIINKEKQIDIISQKIVQSPEKAKNELARNQEKVTTLNEEIAESRDRCTEWARQAEKFKQQEAVADKLLKLLQSIKQEKDQESVLSKDILQNNEVYQEVQSILEELATKRHQLDARLTSKQEAGSKFDLQFKAKKKASNEQLEQVINQKMIYKKKNNLEAEQTEGTLKQKQKVVEELRNREQQVEERVEKMFSLYIELVQKYEESYKQFKGEWTDFLQAVGLI
ncbi:hypothetical protein SNE40_014738 [Patella caerulea]|uniref:Kinetochore protein Nuf2 N-terminal domain-containing protein n=1 Tax=Patella caerulea TaxID=87958 RepID=A0AAN8JLP2_PATCE